MREDFTDVRFGIYDFSRLGLTVVSSNSRYTQNLLPSPSDTTIDIPKGDGKYYFGQTYNQREFTVNVAFDNIKEQTWRKISQIFSTDKLQDLVFNQNPYKTYRAKLKSAPTFSYVCFKDEKTQERIYKGEGSFNFICYHPYAFCFNKYVVQAADYYQCMMPEKIITNSIYENPYKDEIKPKMLTGLIKDHYNKKPNMNQAWKGGYPSIEQVQWGELFFNLDDKKEKQMIIDVRHYWDNIPLWQNAAKLLTTPTLDYDRNLIYMPQYSTTNYYNMDTGLNRQNALIGSRLLVYNPGDISVPFELKLGNLTSHFRKHIGTERFRVSRFNVQRLSLEQIVDWTGLKTFDRDDNRSYKYGTRYVTIIEKNGTEENPESPTFRKLKKSHPEFLYIVEPIPKENLGHFIRIFYWQSSNLPNTSGILSWEEGKEIANRYEELYSLCLTEDEKNELYWDTLFKHILNKYKLLNDSLQKKFFSDSYTYEDFCYDFIFNPPEYFRAFSKIENSKEQKLDYNEFVFNLGHLPNYMTQDYLEITNENFDNIIASKSSNGNKIQSLFLDFDSRMLYNVEDVSQNELNYGISKGIFTDNIIKGKWFLLPPGWSLIDISPVVDEDVWGGKRWIDARPFNWGTIDETQREIFNKYERIAMIDYLSQSSPMCNLKRNDITNKTNNDFTKDSYTAAEIKDILQSWETYQLEDLIQFRRWYEDDVAYQNYKDWRTAKTGNPNALGYEIWRNRIEQAEYGFLKTLADYWRVNHTDVNGLPKDGADIDIWWWNANNYSWNNFPPLYWGYLDLLNKAEIKYVPQFY